ncbi:hypothetical protein H4F73_17190 [Enterobacter hormaechei]|uniref:hypothetical protein n=1 Tax=Enterobacter hormaechei TaxID=158836 RepID=UPI00197D507A|nr:hypothetical protein [Enterobacter hormaechei]MBN4796788.1 hypothetical protein [Enterobacter hormaechei]MBN4820876.1 hypothetical protein [Enterobacter hormaechei]
MSKFLDVSDELSYLLQCGESDPERTDKLFEDLKTISPDKVGKLIEKLDKDTAIFYMWLWFLSIKYNKSNICVMGNLIKVKNIFRDDFEFPDIK